MSKSVDIRTEATIAVQIMKPMCVDVYAKRVVISESLVPASFVDAVIPRCLAQKVSVYGGLLPT